MSQFSSGRVSSPAPWPAPSYSESWPICSDAPASDGSGDPPLPSGDVASVAALLALALAFPLEAADGSAPAFRLGFFLIRAVTRPGASHLSGFVFAYPGHTMPASRHRLHVGLPSSHTSRLREHSQQDLCSSSAPADEGPADERPGDEGPGLPSVGDASSAISEPSRRTEKKRR